jgi:phytoene desaturase
MVALAEEMGVQIVNDCPVKNIEIEKGEVKSVQTDKGDFPCDILLSGADYHHTESLLPQQYRQYSESYWKKKTFAPSALLFYVGFGKKLKKLSHHTLFFDTDFNEHVQTIYDKPAWPKDPLFYASFPSMTDASSAPDGKEAGIFLIPLATDLEDTEAIRKQYFDMIMERMERLTGESVKEDIIFHESFCVKDFKSEYNSCRGNAYGLANTLLQTHILRPKLKSKKVKNLYFTGQLTVPGPGVPPSIISGKVVSELITKNQPYYETAI